MQLLPDRSVVPVLMFHSVGLENIPWVFSQISEPVNLFKKKLSLLKKGGFNSIFWDDLFAYMSYQKKIPSNSIMLTFDDGYLDNWVYGFPYLKKFGFKATIFVNPDFVDPSEEKRLNLEDVWRNRCRIDDLKPAGFMNWSEMKEMEASGFVDIQSHALTHTWYFSGPKIIDYHRPVTPSPYPWLFWNKRPERKPYYMTEDQKSLVKFGHPIFQYQKSLIVKRYYPDEEFVAKIINFVHDKGGASFFEQNNWESTIKNYVYHIKRTNYYCGNYESDEEYQNRVKHEFATSKKILEHNLGKQVDFICWPGGGNNDKVRQLAIETGYKAWTLSSTDLSCFRNIPGANPQNIKRIGTSNKIAFKGHGKGTAGPYFQLLSINSHRNSLIFNFLKKLYQVCYAFRK